jgi:hypothetical protein
MRKPVIALASALGALAIAAAPARADDGGIADIAAGWDGGPGVAISGLDMSGVDQAVAVLGPLAITAAPTTFINTNVQVAGGDTWIGPEVSGGA